ncbi:Rv3654c family TadE-like protein [Microbacterium sp. NPDC057650]|uniref:Rv3654c family TadE-like protein n=1 Tax=unclassified Microbacterium TaxID=2609290 RepID=UPI00366ADBF4
MAGTAFATGVLAVTATLALGLAAVGGASVTAQRSAAAADAAALAAADTASGAVPAADDPCVVAERVAAASGASLVECSVDGLVATVQVRAAYAGLAAVSRARAGPPDGT